MSNERRSEGTLLGFGEVEGHRLARETAERQPPMGTLRLPSSPVPPAAPATPGALGGTVRLEPEDSGQLRAQLEAAIRAGTESKPQVRMPSTRAPTLLGTGPLQEADSHVSTRRGQGQPPLPEAATQSLVPTLKGRGQPPLPQAATQSLVPTLKGRGQPPLPETAAQSLVSTLKGQGQLPPTAEAASPRPLAITLGMSQTLLVQGEADGAGEQPSRRSQTQVKTLMSEGQLTPAPTAEQADPTQAPPAPQSVASAAEPQPAAVQPPPEAVPSTPPPPPATYYSSSPPPAILSQAPAEPASPKRRGGAFLLVPVLGLLLVFGLVGVGAVGYGYYRYSTSFAAQRGAAQRDETEKTTDRAPAEGNRPNSNGSQTTRSTAPPGDGSQTGSAAEPSETEPSATGDASATGDTDGAAGSDAPAVQLKCTPACDQMTGVVCDGKKLKLVDGGLKLEPGTHVCMFQAPGYAVRQYEFEVRKGETLEESVVLTPRQATAKAAPAEAEPEHCGTFIDRCKK